MNESTNQMNMEEIYRKYAVPLKHFVMGYCHNEDVAEDVVADTFYKAIKNIDSFKDGNIFNWLCTIAKNTFLNMAQKKDNNKMSLDDETVAEPAAPESVEEKVVSHESRMELYKAIQNLEPLEREVVYLRIFADLSYRDIGEVIQKSENWTRVTYFRCKEKLKGMMKNE